MEGEHAKHVFKTRFYSNYLTCYIGTDTQDSQECIPNLLFTCRQFDMAQILSDCTCVN